MEVNGKTCNSKDEMVSSGTKHPISIAEHLRSTDIQTASRFLAMS
uniref:Uncharacterized protein n=1 Tax=Rhizophora mucronata TaxID=61149 RepID=A0A2P2LMJ2_RHIMU